MYEIQFIKNSERDLNTHWEINAAHKTMAE